MTRRYTSEIGIIIGPQRDIPAPDVNTNGQIMGVLLLFECFESRTLAKR